MEPAWLRQKRKLEFGNRLRRLLGYSWLVGAAMCWLVGVVGYFHGIDNGLPLALCIVGGLSALLGWTLVRTSRRGWEESFRS